MSDKTILVIDDEIGFQQLYKFLLEPLGYRVEIASDGLEGYEKALLKFYDLIILDVHMPKLTGPEVLKKIKAERPQQRVVIFSSSSDPALKFELEAKRLGAEDCLFKPVEVKDILRVIQVSSRQPSQGETNL